MTDKIESAGFDAMHSRVDRSIRIDCSYLLTGAEEFLEMACIEVGTTH